MGLPPTWALNTSRVYKLRYCVAAANNSVIELFLPLCEKLPPATWLWRGLTRGVHKRERVTTVGNFQLLLCVRS